MGHRERDIPTGLIEVVTGAETLRQFGEVKFICTESELEAETFVKKGVGGVRGTRDMWIF